MTSSARENDEPRVISSSPSLVPALAHHHGDRRAAVVVRARPAPPVGRADALDALVLRVERSDALVLARLGLRRPVRHPERHPDGREGLPAVDRADSLVLPGGADDRADEVDESLRLGPSASAETRAAVAIATEAAGLNMGRIMLWSALARQRPAFDDK